MSKVKRLVLNVSAICCLACWAKSQPVVVKRLLPEHCSAPRPSSQPVTHIMIHFCSAVKQHPTNPYDLASICQIFEDYGVSAHYLIARDGTIYQLVKENRIAYHAGKGKLPFPPYLENSFNSCSIGIELMAIGTQQEMSAYLSAEEYNRLNKNHIGFTQAQYWSLSWLIDDICRRHPQIKRDRWHIVGHDQYAPKRKTDPGSLFDWSRIGLTNN
ncbi:MAG: N-acetylmuramoyl-L-alanine amidase [Cytophagales bacterium]|nr:N-acetylmuramoyl-L-alanine amidase [Bernardetiaceae bacterium]MDW8211861.1 N-acetylmuramoyl-L-alanine amidase [Cytophagales bacterium]